ncbi:MAG: B12-binding domain-containing radical SAM protein [Deltaproteobacteria bacterium]|nr:B12-binding domain-containing radical SAM protein [Deltaproteobacteria bacterium]
MQQPGATAEPWVALVGPEVEENLSLRYLASSVERAGLRTELFPFNASADLPVLLQALCEEPQPAVAALSLSFQWRAQDVLALAMGLREHGFRGHITSGGHFASFAWREIMTEFPEIDSICRFEAEETLAELCQETIAGRSIQTLRGVIFRDASRAPQLGEPREAPELSSLPWPDRRGPAASCIGHPIAAMISSRGCYANCSFCCISTLHRNSSPAKRHRLRAVEDVADEMAHLHHDRGVDIFIFHDDNFFLPRHDDSLARVTALGDALESRRVQRFATVVKARPNDVTDELFSVMRDRVGLVRLFLGVESSTTQGCATLNRGVAASQASRALHVLERLGLYVCFNMLVFDPDASIEALLENMAFIEDNGEHPSNFGRVELYAGTPLLARLQAEERVTGDYLGWSYDQGTSEMQRVFELTMDAFHERNFSGRALANRLQSTRFDAEVARKFHPELCRPQWVDTAKALSRKLASSSAQGVRRVVAYVRSGAPESANEAFLAELSAELRACEAQIEADALQMEQEVVRTVGATCDHAPVKGIPVARVPGAAPRHREMVAGCGVAR